jgi:hypothetical protein
MTYRQEGGRTSVNESSFSTIQLVWPLQLLIALEAYPLQFACQNHDNKAKGDQTIAKRKVNRGWPSEFGDLKDSFDHLAIADSFTFILSTQWFKNRCTRNTSRKGENHYEYIAGFRDTSHENRV